MNMKTLIITIIVGEFLTFYSLFSNLFLKNEVLAALFLWLF